MRAWCTWSISRPPNCRPAITLFPLRTSLIRTHNTTQSLLRVDPYACAPCHFRHTRGPLDLPRIPCIHRWESVAGQLWHPHLAGGCCSRLFPCLPTTCRDIWMSMNVRPPNNGLCLSACWALLGTSPYTRGGPNCRSAVFQVSAFVAHQQPALLLCCFDMATIQLISCVSWTKYTILCILFCADDSKRRASCQHISLKQPTCSQFMRLALESHMRH